MLRTIAAGNILKPLRRRVQQYHTNTACALAQEQPLRFENTGRHIAPGLGRYLLGTAAYDDELSVTLSTVMRPNHTLSLVTSAIGKMRLLWSLMSSKVNVTDEGSAKIDVELLGSLVQRSEHM